MVVRNTIILLGVFYLCVSQSGASKILGVFPFPSVSHQVVYLSLMKELSRRGHEVTVLTTDTIENISDYKNLKRIDISNGYIPWRKFFQNIETLKSEERITPSYFEEAVFKVSEEIVDVQLSVPEVKNLINDENQKFDLVFVEWLIFPSIYSFAERFKCPFIGIASFEGNLSGFDAVGNPSHPILNPDLFLPYETNLKFFERLHSVYYSIIFRYKYWYKYLPSHNQIARKHFGNNITYIGDIEKRVDMLFLNKNDILAKIRPNVPAIINLGSMHLQPAKPLPMDLQMFLDSATEGVIYFSLGTNVKGNTLSEEKRTIFVNTFAELPYKVIWKWESDAMQNKSSNIKLSKWLPQNDLLGHENIKIFITQGGQQSMEEAIHNKVPIIVIPFYTDQINNAKKVNTFKIGKSLDYNTLTKESLRRTIEDIISDKSYKDNIQQLNTLLEDEPMTPMQRAVWWTEYVLRHGGAAHLRSGAVNLPLYQYFLLDVIGFAIAIIFFVLYISYKIIHCVIKYLYLLKEKQCRHIIKEKKK